MLKSNTSLLARSAAAACSRSMSCSSRLCATKPFADIPVPKGAIPFFGHMFRVKKNFIKTMDQMFKEIEGPIFKIKALGSWIVMTRDPAANKEINAAEGKYPKRGFEDKFQWLYKKRQEDPMMVFESDKGWRDVRSSTGKTAAPANAYSCVPGFNIATDRLIRNIKDTQDSEGYVNDMAELVMYWSFEAGAFLALGVDFDSKGDYSADALLLKKALNKQIELFNTVSYTLPYYRIFPSSIVRDFHKTWDIILGFGTKYADQHMDRIMKGVDKGEKEYGQSLLEQWLIDGKISKLNAINNAAGMMAAGLDTTANTVSFLLHDLAVNREVQDKLYSEVTSVLGTDTDPDTQSIQKIPYLTNVIKESQRVSPVVTATSTRVIPQDSTILGYAIPAKTTVMYHMMNAIKDPKLFDEPEKYNPDRWNSKEINPYALTPFGIGPRSCWGRRFAEVEIKVLLAKLSQRYILESDLPPNSRFPVEYSELSRPGKPLRVKFVERS